MTQAQRITGKELVVEFIVNAGGTFTISGDQTSLNVTFDTDEADMTAGDDDYAFMKATVRRISATMDALYKGENEDEWNNMVEHVEGQLLFYPEGKSSGKPKGGFPCYLKTKSMPIPHNDRIVRTATFSPQGGEYGTTVFDPDVHTYTP